MYMFSHVADWDNFVIPDWTSWRPHRRRDRWPVPPCLIWTRLTRFVRKSPLQSKTSKYLSKQKWYRKEGQTLDNPRYFWQKNTNFNLQSDQHITKCSSIVQRKIWMVERFFAWKLKDLNFSSLYLNQRSILFTWLLFMCLAVPLVMKDH